jgi:hypothetical protein
MGRGPNVEREPSAEHVPDVKREPSAQPDDSDGQGDQADDDEDGLDHDDEDPGLKHSTSVLTWKYDMVLTSAQRRGYGVFDADARRIPEERVMRLKKRMSRPESKVCINPSPSYGCASSLR